MPAVGDNEVDMVFRGSHTQRLEADIVVADGRAAHRREEDDVSTLERQTPCRFGEYKVVADQHANRAKISSREDRERFAALSATALAPSRANLAVAPDLLAVAAQEECCVVGFPVGIHEITAHHEVQVVSSRGAAEPVEHALDRL